MKRKGTNAQAMVEFALILPVLLMLVMGILEMGRLLTAYTGVVTASREAARYGATTGTNAAGVPKAQDCEGIRDAAKRTSILADLQDEDITIQYDSGPGTGIIATCSGTVSSFTPQTGDRIVVTVQYHYESIAPLVPTFSFDIVSSSARTYVGAISIPQ